MLERDQASSRSEIDRYDVDPPLVRKLLARLIVGLSQRDQPLLFSRRQGLNGRPHCVSPAAAHFYERKHATPLRDDVDLSLPDAEIPFPNAVTVDEQVLDSQPLAEIPELPPAIGSRRVPLNSQL